MSFTIPPPPPPSGSLLKSLTNPRIVHPLILLVPLLISLQWPLLRIHPFIPRQLIYSNYFPPFFLAPWSWPANASAVVSRLIQVWLLYRLPCHYNHQTHNSHSRSHSHQDRQDHQTKPTIKIYYTLWLLTALARTVTGFLLTRAVGWAYPRLFNHYALYESAGGFGSVLIAYLVLSGNNIRNLDWVCPGKEKGTEGLIRKRDDENDEEEDGIIIGNGMAERRRGTSTWIGTWIKMRNLKGTWELVGLCTLLSWLDASPWTYAMSIICAFILSSLRALSQFTYNTFFLRLNAKHAKHPHLDHPMSLSPTTSPGHSKYPNTTFSMRRISPQILTPLLTLLFLSLPHLFFSVLSSPLSPISFPTSQSSYPYHPLPPSPHPTRPLLEILILSHPRPNDPKPTFNASLGHTPTTLPPTSILYQTISSYLPFLPAERDAPVRLSVFTHARDGGEEREHRAFEHVKEYLRLDILNAHTYVHVNFHVDKDSHPSSLHGQYLHLAEALRWAGEKEEKEKAEWVLLIEDDFALCGVWGWDGIVRVMRRLEEGRVRVDGGEERLERLGGFVGTGGSGLIIHHTLLPLLSHILHLHALSPSSSPSSRNPLPQHTPPRPPDLIIQDCLLGVDPLCPMPLTPPGLGGDTVGIAMFEGWVPVVPFHYSPSRARGWGTIEETGGGPLVITSRLVLDHLGGSASTALGRVYGAEKWRCGWRHPFHGRQEVDVVVV